MDVITYHDSRYNETVGKGFDYVSHMSGVRREYAFDFCAWVSGNSASDQPVYSNYDGLTEKAAQQIEKTIRARIGIGAVR